MADLSKEAIAENIRAQISKTETVWAIGDEEYPADEARVQLTGDEARVILALLAERERLMAVVRPLSVDDERLVFELLQRGFDSEMQSFDAKEAFHHLTMHGPFAVVRHQPLDAVTPPKLVESAHASGRFVHIITYCDGPNDTAPQTATLLFRRPEDARECARVLSESPRCEPGRM